MNTMNAKIVAIQNNQKDKKFFFKLESSSYSTFTPKAKVTK
jgi:hypothetical protein